jgi:hypothetical protein
MVQMYCTFLLPAGQYLQEPRYLCKAHDATEIAAEKLAKRPQGHHAQDGKHTAVYVTLGTRGGPTRTKKAAPRAASSRVNRNGKGGDGENVELNVPPLQFMPFLVPDLTKPRLLYKHSSGPRSRIVSSLQTFLVKKLVTILMINSKCKGQLRNT